MCNQAVSLLAATIESHGIATSCIVLLRQIARRVRPPRALFVPFAHGYPLGMPHDVQGQLQVMRAALALLERDAAPPLLADYPAASFSYDRRMAQATSRANASAVCA
jgi:hypothetical protein